MFISIHEKYENSAIKELEKIVLDFINSDAGQKRESQCGDARGYSLWLNANTNRPLLEKAMAEMNDWYSHHPMKELLEKALK